MTAGGPASAAASGEPPQIPGARLLEGPSHRGGGNLLYVVAHEAGERLLKLYRQRRRSWRAPWRSLGHLLEGKRAVSPRARFETEHELLRLWASHGLDVPAVFDAPLPPGVAPPGLFMAYCPGETLETVVARDGVGAAALIERYARDVDHRHTLAEQHRDPRLIHEHPSIVHVLVHADRLVTFDLEGAWRFPRLLERQMSDELAGLARSLCKTAPSAESALLDAFCRGYGSRARLRKLAALGVRGGLLRRLRRLRGSARQLLRGKLSKPEALRRLLARLDGSPEDESNDSPQ